VEDALRLAAFGPARVVVFNGGTGIAPRDTTFDVLARTWSGRSPASASCSGC
jgi:molybdopterin biosynthesis enzyme MoaB